jgi:hypothetical protein
MKCVGGIQPEQTEEKQKEISVSSVSSCSNPGTPGWPVLRVHRVFAAHLAFPSTAWVWLSLTRLEVRSSALGVRCSSLGARTTHPVSGHKLSHSQPLSWTAAVQGSSSFVIRPSAFPRIRASLGKQWTAGARKRKPGRAAAAVTQLRSAIHENMQTEPGLKWDLNGTTLAAVYLLLPLDQRAQFDRLYAHRAALQEICERLRQVSPEQLYWGAGSGGLPKGPPPGRKVSRKAPKRRKQQT